MELFVKRMVEEANDLEGKIKRLDNFINDNSNDSRFKKLSAEEQDLDRKQLSFMNGYLGVLQQRIKLHNK